MTSSNWKQVLAAEVAARGLPSQVGARGWIHESQDFYHDDIRVATTHDGLKGWLYVSRDAEDEFDQPAFSDVEQLQAVVEQFVANGCDGGTYITVMDNGQPREIALQNDDADGKTWDCDYHIDEADFLALLNEDMGEEHTDLGDADIVNFLWDYCDKRNSDVDYSLSYHVAWVEFDDGFKLGFTNNEAGDVVLMRYARVEPQQSGAQPSKFVDVDADEVAADVAADAALPVWPFPTAGRP